MTTLSRIACSTGSLFMWGLPKALGTIAEAGFNAVELMVTRDPRTHTAEAVKRIADQTGLDVVAVHAPMLVLTRRVWGPNYMPIIDKSAALAKDVGADVVIVHPPYLWELKYQAWLLGSLNRFSADRGVAIAVENMFRLWVRGRPIRGHRWVSPTDLEQFTQVTLDTSHCGADGYDILEALDRVGPRTAHVHLSDSRSQHRDNHALPGTGTLPLEEFVKRLPDVGYRGAISLELDMREYAQDQRKTKETLVRAREFIEDNLY